MVGLKTPADLPAKQTHARGVTAKNANLDRGCPRSYTNVGLARNKKRGVDTRPLIDERWPRTQQETRVDTRPLIDDCLGREGAGASAGGGCAPQNCHHVAAAKALGVTLGSTEVATVLLGANKRMVNETPSRHAHHTNGDCL